MTINHPLFLWAGAERLRFENGEEENPLFFDGTQEKRWYSKATDLRSRLHQIVTSGCSVTK